MVIGLLILILIALLWPALAMDLVEGAIGLAALGILLLGVLFVFSMVLG